MRRASIPLACVAMALASLPSIASASAPDTLQLSSWTSTIAEGQIVGGTMTVTITNPGPGPSGQVRFDLSAVPCVCSVASSSATAGFVGTHEWSVGRIAPGATETLRIVYGEQVPGALHSSVVLGVRSLDGPRAV